MPRPTVVVTRPAGQSRQLTEALHAAGLDVLGFPLLAIGPAADDTALRTALGRLADYALVVFVSPNAVSFALDALAQVQEAAGAAQWPAHVPVAVVGPSSVAALAERGIAPPTHRVIAPAGAQVDANAGGDGPGEAPRFDSEALWSELDTTPGAFSGRRVLIIRGNGGRDWLGDRLREAGATVDAVEAYTRTLPEPTGMQWQAVRASLTPEAPPYAWLLTSSEAVRNLDALARLHLSPQEHERLKQVQCIAPHARIAAQAQALGFAHVLPAAPGDTGLLAACTQWGNAHAGPAAPPVATAATAATVATPVPLRRMRELPRRPRHWASRTSCPRRPAIPDCWRRARSGATPMRVPRRRRLPRQPRQPRQPQWPRRRPPPLQCPSQHRSQRPCRRRVQRNQPDLPDPRQRRSNA